MRTQMDMTKTVKLTALQGEILMAALRSSIAEHKADGTESGLAFAGVLRTLTKHIEKQTVPHRGRPFGFKPKKKIKTDRSPN